MLVNVEKERMAELFPEHYREYSAKVPLFIPSLRARTTSEKSKFSWDLYKKNKEYRALIGAILYWTALALKAVIF